MPIEQILNTPVQETKRLDDFEAIKNNALNYIDMAFSELDFSEVGEEARTIYEKLRSEVAKVEIISFSQYPNIPNNALGAWASIRDNADGQLFINADYFNQEHVLDDHEWAEVVVHELMHAAGIYTEGLTQALARFMVKADLPAYPEEVAKTTEFLKSHDIKLTDALAIFIKYSPENYQRQGFFENTQQGRHRMIIRELVQKSIENKVREVGLFTDQQSALAYIKGVIKQIGGSFDGIFALAGVEDIGLSGLAAVCLDDYLGKFIAPLN